MMSNDKFINGVWDKYNDYIQQKNKDELYKKRYYKKEANIDREYKFKKVLNIAVVFFAGCILLGTGVVFAINNIDKIWKEPRKYQSILEYEETKSNEYDVRNSDNINISEETAKEYAIEFLNKIKYNNCDNLIIELKPNYSESGNFYYSIRSEKEMNRGMNILIDTQTRSGNIF